jgi:hypothetical protein
MSSASLTDLEKVGAPNARKNKGKEEYYLCLLWKLVNEE